MFFSRLLLVALVVTTAFAQTFLGNLAGTATDSSGASLSGAVVKLDRPSTGLTRSTVSSVTGDFRFVDLPVGIYTLAVSSLGFATKKTDAVEIAVSKTTNIVVSLGVAQQQSTMEVTASAVSIETTSSALTADVDRATVQDL